MKLIGCFRDVTGTFFTIPGSVSKLPEKSILQFLKNAAVSNSLPHTLPHEMVSQSVDCLVFYTAVKTPCSKPDFDRFGQGSTPENSSKDVGLAGPSTLTRRTGIGPVGFLV